MTVKGYRIGPLLKKTWREIVEDNLTTLAASAAYNFFFSLFPLLLFLGPLLSLVGNRHQMVEFVIAQLVAVLPQQQLAAVSPILNAVVFSKSAPGLMSIGLLLAAWSGSNIFGTLIGALNVAYDVTETRPWWKQQVIRLTSFVVAGIVITASTVILLNGEGVANWIGANVGLGGATILVWKVLQVPLALAGLFALAFLAFYMLPNVEQRKGRVFVAAALTTILWIAATLLFRLYVQHFPPNPAYGAIGGVIILLTWMYYTMFVILLGGEFASELHHGTGALTPNAGAIYVGRLVTDSGPGSTSVRRA